MYGKHITENIWARSDNCKILGYKKDNTKTKQPVLKLIMWTLCQSDKCLIYSFNIQAR